MNLKLCIWCLFWLCDFVTAHFDNIAQNAGIVMDTDKFQFQLGQNHGHLLSSYPRYNIVQPTGSQVEPITSISTVTENPSLNTMPAKITVLNEFPRDLLQIAQQKLGLKSLDEMPSISELGELLGTNNEAETVQYIRQLTSTEQGIALIKAYIESSDYTDATNNEEFVAKQRTDYNKKLSKNKLNKAYPSNDQHNENDKNDNATDNDQLDEFQRTETTPTVVTSSTPKTGIGFFERMYKNLYNIWLTGSNTQTTQSTTQMKIQQQLPNHMKIELKRPVLVHLPIPYHYPIPLRPLMVQKNAFRNLQNTNTTSGSKINMNSSKFSLSPQILNIIQATTNIPPKAIINFLQKKPKLYELVSRVNQLAVNYERGSQMEHQLVAAIQKAIEQDEDLKELVNSAKTLK